VKRFFLWLGFALILAILLFRLAEGIVGRSFFRMSQSKEGMEQIVLSGSEASGRILDAGGGWFNEGRPTEILISSRKTENGWDRPEGVVIRNGRLCGSIRILGLGRNGEAELVKVSSHRLGQTARAQEAAPTGIQISNVEIEGTGGIPLYLAPGVTHTKVESCHFTGWSKSVGIYLDAESAHNTVLDCTFSIKTAREVIAVDGSANNRIEGSRFEQVEFGGIYLYRNCGEGGAVRHQSPQGNLIVGNHFDTEALRFRASVIWIGSRNGQRPYCHLDDGFPFGSSVDNRDFADRNTVKGNTFTDVRPGSNVRDDGQDNTVSIE